MLEAIFGGIRMINNNDELYDKCEKMEQLFEKYYLPLKDNWNKLKEYIKELEYYSIEQEPIWILQKMQELEDE